MEVHALTDYSELKLDINKIVDRIKTINNVKRDKDVAQLLGIDQRNLASNKSRKGMPFNSLFRYALKHKISLDYLFWGKT